MRFADRRTILQEMSAIIEKSREVRRKEKKEVQEQEQEQEQEQ